MSSLNDLRSVLAAPLPSREAFERLLSQHARLLGIETPLPAAALLAERLRGREALSECFRFDIECLATSAHFELKRLIGEELTVRLLQADGSQRSWHGYLTAAAQLGADGGLARYRLTLEPWLAFLAHRRNNYIHQDKTALEIAQALFAEYPQANFELRVQAPLRKWSIRTQYRESDLEFLQRILAAEGLSYYFEHEQQQDGTAGSGKQEEGKRSHARHMLVIVHARHDWPQCAQSPIRFRRLSPTEAEDAIHSWSAKRSVQTNAVTLSAWDYASLGAPAAAEVSALQAGELPTLEHYAGAGGYRYQNAEDAARIARLRLQAHELANKRFTADSSVRQLAAAQRFQLTGQPHREGADDAFVVLEIEHEAANNLQGGMADLQSLAALASGSPQDLLGSVREIERGSYRNRFECVAATVPIVPAYRPAPSAPGEQSALVVGVQGERLVTERDHRVKIQFPWQRGATPNAGGLAHPAANGNAPGNETSGTWVRVAEALAGPNWGANFTPRIGTEVLVGFIEGDIDRPVIVGQLHNGQDALPWPAGVDSGANHPGVIAGVHTLTLDGAGYNQWVIDDATGQLRMRLASSYGASQLNLGYLIAQSDARRGSFRGRGFEFRTDAWGVLRARQGLLMSATIRPQAASTQLDAAEALAQLKASKSLAATLSEAAAQHRSAKLAANAAQEKLIERLDPQAQGRFEGAVGGQDALKPAAGSREGSAPVERFAAPLIVLDSPASVAFASPSAAWFAGQNIHASVQADTQVSAAHTFSAVAANAAALFTHAGGVRATAANGPLSIQAHTDKLEVLADKSVTVTSVNDSIEVKANQKITLIGAQASITLEGGNITFACPGTFSVKGSSHAFQGPGSNPVRLPNLPTELATVTHWVGAKYLDGETGEPVEGAEYEIELEGGTKLGGTLDAQGEGNHESVVNKPVRKITYKPRKPDQDKPHAPLEDLLG